MAVDSSIPLLEVTGIGKRFPGVVALDGVDFKVRAGEIHALMGENGAGKSTLIKAITGVHRRDSGTVRLAGAEIDPRSPRDAEAVGISTVYQEINLIGDLSVAENICLGREPMRFGMIRWGLVRRRAQAALAKLGLKLDVGKQLATCSVAVQQMVAIARALDTSAKLLILDEPTSSLDADEVTELFAVLRRLREQQLGIVFVTHFLDQVYAVCDRITILRDGRLVGEYPAADLPRVQLVSKMIGRDLAPARGSEAPAAPSEQPVRSHQAHTQTAPLLRTRDLSRRRSVGGVNLSVNRGEIVGLAGLLGSGRSELARLLFGIDAADTGSIEVDGKPVRIKGPRQAAALGFALTPEDRKREGIIPNLSVRENIILALQARRGVARPLSPAVQRQLCDRFMEALKIRARDGEQTVSTLSGGNQQKVILARWLAMEPRLLIVDEPTRGIDIGARAEIEALISSLCAKGMAVVLICSELDELVRISHRALVLRDHRHVADLAGDELTEPAVMHAIAKVGHGH